LFLVEVDGNEVAEIGPGAVVGERSGQETGVRTATLRATTRARVAEASPDLLNGLELDELAEAHHREAPAG
jgi:CRP-like cAMP-binding protein